MTQDIIQELRSYLTYDPETGLFFWRVSRGRQSAGSVAGTVKDGYVCINTVGGIIRAHRLAWAFMTGDWPPEGVEVDHKNRKRADNRWSNLRLALPLENSANASTRTDNTSGHPGVHRYKATGRWQANIQRAGKLRHLGYFATKEEAIAARRAAEAEHFGPFAPKRDGG